jgi:hypothetical protein
MPEIGGDRMMADRKRSPASRHQVRAMKPVTDFSAAFRRRSILIDGCVSRSVAASTKSGTPASDPQDAAFAGENDA